MTEHSKHTPGPWKVLAFATGIKGFIAIVTDPPDGKVAEHICDVFPFGKRPGADSRELAQHNANARLIAAAPDMLAALEKARSRLLSSDLVRIDVEAAIAKATGANT